MGLRVQTILPDAKNQIGRLKNLKNISLEVMKEQTDEIFEDSIKDLQKYPPKNEGNRPPPPYWQRTEGMMIRKAGGQIGLRDGARYKSQDMKNQWNFATAVRGNEVEGRLVNTAWYSPMVHGSIDDVTGERQTWFHKAHGWPVAVDVVRDQVLRVKGLPERIGEAIKKRFKNIF